VEDDELFPPPHAESKTVNRARSVSKIDVVVSLLRSW
jgi:hypothetical protein